MSYKFEWTKEMSVGEEHIDFQHKRLLEQLNKIIDVLVFDKVDAVVLLETLNFFKEYITDHLAYEEKYMVSLNYPFMGPHVAEHHNFIKYYDEFMEKAQAGVDKALLLVEVEKYIGHWWIEHIGKMDRNYYLFSIGEPTIQ